MTSLGAYAPSGGQVQKPPSLKCEHERLVVGWLEEPCQGAPTLFGHPLLTEV